MAGQLFVEESLVRRKQIDHAVVLFQLSVEKQLDLFHEGNPQIVVKPGKLGALRIQQTHVAGLQPLCKKF